MFNIFKKQEEIDERKASKDDIKFSFKQKNNKVYHVLTFLKHEENVVEVAVVDSITGDAEMHYYRKLENSRGNTLQEFCDLLIVALKEKLPVVTVL